MGDRQQEYSSGACPASSIRFGITGGTPTLLSSAPFPHWVDGAARSLSSAGEERVPLTAGAGTGLWSSSSERIGRFLKGSFEWDAPAWRLRVPLLSEPGAAPIEEQRISELSVPVLAGGAGEPPVPPASLAQTLTSGVPDLLCPRTVVLRSSGAVAPDWGSTFMIVGINRAGFRWQRDSFRLD